MKERTTFDIRKMLKIRGFSISERGLNDKLLIPEQQHIDYYYRQLRTYSFRIFLRDVIKHQDFFISENIARFTSPEVTEKYIQFLCSVNLCRKENDGYILVERPVKSFGKTLEWYVSEVLQREFDLETLCGKRLKGHFSGGDFDALVPKSNAEELMRYLGPNAHLDIVPGGTHYLELQYPKRLHRAVQRIIERVTVRAEETAM